MIVVHSFLFAILRDITQQPYITNKADNNSNSRVKLYK